MKNVTEEISIALIGERELMPGYVSAYSGCEGIKVKYDVCYGGESGEKEFEEGLKHALGDEKVRAVEIFLPPAMVPEIAQRAIRVNKHVSLGPPPARDVETMLVLKSMASVQRLIFRINDPYIYYPPIQKAKEMIMNGEIGEPSMIRIKTYHMAHPSRDKMDPLDVLLKREVYKLSLINFFMGDITRVFAWIDTDQRPTGAGHILMWRYRERGRYGIMDITESLGSEDNTPTYHSEHTIEITGTDGYLWIRGGPGMDLKVPPVLLYRHRRCYEIGEAEIERNWTDTLRHSARHFSSLLKGKKRKGILFGVDTAIKSLKIATAAVESSEKGKEITV